MKGEKQKNKKREEIHYDFPEYHRIPNLPKEGSEVRGRKCA